MDPLTSHSTPGRQFPMVLSSIHLHLESNPMHCILHITFWNYKCKFYIQAWSHTYITKTKPQQKTVYRVVGNIWNWETPGTQRWSCKWIELPEYLSYAEYPSHQHPRCAAENAESKLEEAEWGICFPNFSPVEAFALNHELWYASSLALINATNQECVFFCYCCCYN